MKTVPKFFVFALFFMIFSGVSAQEESASVTARDTIPINLENSYRINSIAIIPFSETILLRDRILDRSEYSISYEKGEFSLSDTLAYSIFDTLLVTYKTIRLGLKREYKRRSLVIKYDEDISDTLRILTPETSPLSAESIFGRDIQKSGTLVRGFTVGTTRDFTVNSGLRLQLSGRLSDEIEIVAALTDENTPIQPEGNTERLEELDKVYIEIRHPNAVGTFGDYDLIEKVGEFGQINRKLQGLKGEAIFKDHNAVVALAGSRGKFNTNQFNGQDGVQGPYRLTGINNEPGIIVIAGSEKVFLDGEPMARGENNDFIIDYSIAEITFNPNRLITSASRITVDFEYTDRNYQRNFFGSNAKSKFFDDRFSLKVNYYREGDDQDNPVDFSISEEDKRILEEAGDNRFLAAKSGVKIAEPDSNGIVRGIYSEIDTLIDGNPFKYYVYSPGDTNSIYDVSFSFVGQGFGDYVRESLGRYRFVGIGQGGYLPVILIPLPELKQMGNIVMDISPFENLNINLELAGSIHDRNRFSSKDSEDNNGYARNLRLSFKPTEVNIGGVGLGKIGFNLRDRFAEERFTTLDRFNTVEFDRDYGVEGGSGGDEILREVDLILQPVEELNILGKYGYLKRAGNFSSNRFMTDVRLLRKNEYGLNYNLDYVKSSRSANATDWMKQKGEGFLQFGFFKPGVQFLYEDRKEKLTGRDSLISGSLRYLEVGPFIELIRLGGFDVRAQYSLRDESFPIAGLLEKESRSVLQSYQLSYRGIPEVTSTLNVTFRNKKYTDKFKELGRLDKETVLIRSQSRFNLFDRFLDGDLFYEVSTQLSSRLEKVFVKVPQGTGNYIFLGDLNNNGIADEEEFELVAYDGDYIQTTIPTEELFPVIDLKTSTRWKAEFERIFTGDGLFSELMKPISTETYIRVEENSTETDIEKIYLLQFSNFLNDSTTIRGSNLFQQDIHLFRNDAEFSTRFRFLQRNSLNQFSGGLERGYFRERSLRIRFRLLKEVNNQTELTNQDDHVAAPANTNRSRIVTNNDVSTDFSYRPVREVEVGLKLRVGRSQDDLPANPTIIDLNSETLRFNLSFAGLGRLRIEAERTELNANATANAIPFEMLRGNRLGKNYFWRVNFDYRFGSNLQTTLSYDGRLQGESKAVHTMRAEARAYF